METTPPFPSFRERVLRSLRAGFNRAVHAIALSKRRQPATPDLNEVPLKFLSHLRPSLRRTLWFRHTVKQGCKVLRRTGLERRMTRKNAFTGHWNLSARSTQ